MKWKKTNEPVETNQIEELRAELDTNPGQWYQVSDWPRNSYPSDSTTDQDILMATHYSSSRYRIRKDCVMRIAEAAASIWLLVTNTPGGDEARIVMVGLDHEDRYPIDPGESVASEHDTRAGAAAALDEFYSRGSEETP